MLYYASALYNMHIMNIFQFAYFIIILYILVYSGFGFDAYWLIALLYATTHTIFCREDFTSCVLYCTNTNYNNFNWIWEHIGNNLSFSDWRIIHRIYMKCFFFMLQTMQEEFEYMLYIDVGSTYPFYIHGGRWWFGICLINFKKLLCGFLDLMHFSIIARDIASIYYILCVGRCN